MASFGIVGVRTTRRLGQVPESQGYLAVVERSFFNFKLDGSVDEDTTPIVLGGALQAIGTMIASKDEYEVRIGTMLLRDLMSSSLKDIFREMGKDMKGIGEGVGDFGRTAWPDHDGDKVVDGKDPCPFDPDCDGDSVDDKHDNAPTDPHKDDIPDGEDFKNLKERLFDYTERSSFGEFTSRLLDRTFTQEFGDDWYK